MKPQKKISININLDGKRKEEKTETQENIIGKSKEEMENIGDREGKLRRGDTGVEVNEKKESSREKEGVFEEKIKPDEGDAKQLLDIPAIRVDKRGMWVNIAAEKEEVVGKKAEGEDEDFDLWHSALLSKEEKESKNQWEEAGGMKPSKSEELTRDERRSTTGKEEEEERARKESGGQNSENVRESTCAENARNSLEVSKPDEALMERVKRWKEEEEEDTMRFNSQRSSSESHDDRSECHCFI